MNVGESIKSLREAAGLMQRELAEQVGISASMLSLVEAGKREPSIGVLRAVGRALEIPASVLFAIALDDTERNARTQLARNVHELTKNLFEASRHALIARRLQSEHANTRRHISKRSA